MKKALLLTILVILSFSFIVDKPGSESLYWTQFRGPNASGIAPQGANPPVIFSADTNLLWKTPVVSGFSSPCIVNDKIFLTGFNPVDSLLYTIAYDRGSGELLWQDSIRPKELPDIHPVNNYASKTITSNGQYIFAAFSAYGIIAYDLLGNRIWNYEQATEQDYYGGSSSPIIYNDLVISVIGSNSDPMILALNCQTGDSAWTIRAKDRDWGNFSIKSTPLIWKNLLILHLPWNLVAYDLIDKSPAWWMPIPNAGSGTPVINQDTLFVNSWLHGGEEGSRNELMSFQEMLSQYDANGDERLVSEELPDDQYFFIRPDSPDAPLSKRKLNDEFFLNSFDQNENGAYDEDEWLLIMELIEPYMQDHGMYALSMEGSGERSQEEMLWKINKDTPEVPSPLISGNNAFFIKNGGKVTVINRSTGDLAHKLRIKSTGTILSSPLLTANRIYTCSYNGSISVLSATDYMVLAQNKLSEKIGASPVALDDILYVRTDKHLYAFKNEE